MTINKFYILLIIFLILFTSFITFKIIDNRLKSIQKLNLIKFFVLLSSILFITLIIIIFFFDSKLNNLSIVLYSIIFSFFYFTSLFYFLIVYGNIKPPKPDKYLLKQDNYLDFSNYLNKRIKIFNYKEKYMRDNLKIYHRVIKRKNYYIIDARLEELTEENFNELYEKEIFPIIEQDFNQAKKSMRYELFITIIISVDRMSSMFNRFINTLDQDKRYYKLPIGVSFGGNKMYIPNEIEGFGLMQFNQLKKEIKIILELENKGNKR